MTKWIVLVVFAAARAASAAEPATLDAAFGALSHQVAFNNPLHCQKRIYDYKTDKGRLILEYRETLSEIQRLRRTIETGWFQFIIDSAKTKLVKALADLDKLKAEAQAKGIDLDNDRIVGGVDYATWCIRDPKL